MTGQAGLWQKELTVFVTYHIDPKGIETFKEAERPVWAACAETPECIFFDVFQDPAEPGRFRFVEIWSKGREWFENVQMKKLYYDELFKKIRPLWLKEPVMEYFEREGEGSIFTDRYLQGAKKVEK